MATTPLDPSSPKVILTPLKQELATLAQKEQWHGYLVAEGETLKEASLWEVFVETVKAFIGMESTLKTDSDSVKNAVEHYLIENIDSFDGEDIDNIKALAAKVGITPGVQANVPSEKPTPKDLILVLIHKTDDTAQQKLTEIETLPSTTGITQKEIKSVAPKSPTDALITETFRDKVIENKQEEAKGDSGEKDQTDSSPKDSEKFQQNELTETLDGSQNNETTPTEVINLDIAKTQIPSPVSELFIPLHEDTPLHEDAPLHEDTPLHEDAKSQLERSDSEYPDSVDVGKSDNPTSETPITKTSVPENDVKHDETGNKPETDSSPQGFEDMSGARDEFPSTVTPQAEEQTKDDPRIVIPLSERGVVHHKSSDKPSDAAIKKQPASPINPNPTDKVYDEAIFEAENDGTPMPEDVNTLQFEAKDLNLKTSPKGWSDSFTLGNIAKVIFGVAFVGLGVYFGGAAYMPSQSAPAGGPENATKPVPTGASPTPLSNLPFQRPIQDAEWAKFQYEQDKASARVGTELFPENPAFEQLKSPLSPYSLKPPPSYEVTWYTTPNNPQTPTPQIADYAANTANIDYDGVKTDYDGIKIDYDGIKIDYDGIEYPANIDYDGIKLHKSQTSPKDKDLEILSQVPEPQRPDQLQPHVSDYRAPPPQTPINAQEPKDPSVVKVDTNDFTGDTIYVTFDPSKLQTDLENNLRSETPKASSPPSTTKTNQDTSPIPPSAAHINSVVNALFGLVAVGVVGAGGVRIAKMVKSERGLDDRIRPKMKEPKAKTDIKAQKVSERGLDDRIRPKMMDPKAKTNIKAQKVIEDILNFGTNFSDNASLLLNDILEGKLDAHLELLEAFLDKKFLSDARIINDPVKKEQVKKILLATFYKSLNGNQKIAEKIFESYKDFDEQTVMKMVESIVSDIAHRQRSLKPINATWEKNVREMLPYLMNLIENPVMPISIKSGDIAEKKFEKQCINIRLAMSFVKNIMHSRYNNPVIENCVNGFIKYVANHFETPYVSDAWNDSEFMNIHSFGDFIHQVNFQIRMNKKEAEEALLAKLVNDFVSELSDEQIKNAVSLKRQIEINPKVTIESIEKGFYDSNSYDINFLVDLDYLKSAENKNVYQNNMSLLSAYVKRIIGNTDHSSQQFVLKAFNRLAELDPKEFIDLAKSCLGKPDFASRDVVRQTRKILIQFIMDGGAYGFNKQEKTDPMPIALEFSLDCKKYPNNDVCNDFLRQFVNEAVGMDLPPYLHSELQQGSRPDSKSKGKKPIEQGKSGQIEESPISSTKSSSPSFLSNLGSSISDRFTFSTPLDARTKTSIKQLEQITPNNNGFNAKYDMSGHADRGLVPNKADKIFAPFNMELVPYLQSSTDPDHKTLTKADGASIELKAFDFLIPIVLESTQESSHVAEGKDEKKLEPIHLFLPSNLIGDLKANDRLKLKYGDTELNLTIQNEQNAPFTSKISVIEEALYPKEIHGFDTSNMVLPERPSEIRNLENRKQVLPLILNKILESHRDDISYDPKTHSFTKKACLLPDEINDPDISKIDWDHVEVRIAKGEGTYAGIGKDGLYCTFVPNAEKTYITIMDNNLLVWQKLDLTSIHPEIVKKAKVPNQIFTIIPLGILSNSVKGPNGEFILSHLNNFEIKKSLLEFNMSVPKDQSEAALKSKANDVVDVPSLNPVKSQEEKKYRDTANELNAQKNRGFIDAINVVGEWQVKENKLGKNTISCQISFPEADKDSLLNSVFLTDSRFSKIDQKALIAGETKDLNKQRYCEYTCYIPKLLEVLKVAQSELVKQPGGQIESKQKMKLQETEPVERRKSRLENKDASKSSASEQRTDGPPTSQKNILPNNKTLKTTKIELAEAEKIEKPSSASHTPPSPAETLKSIIKSILAIKNKSLKKEYYKILCDKLEKKLVLKEEYDISDELRAETRLKSVFKQMQINESTGDSEDISEEIESVISYLTNPVEFAQQNFADDSDIVQKSSGGVIVPFVESPYQEPSLKQQIDALKPRANENLAEKLVEVQKEIQKVLFGN